MLDIKDKKEFEKHEEIKKKYESALNEVIDEETRKNSHVAPEILNYINQQTTSKWDIGEWDIEAFDDIEHKNFLQVYKSLKR